MPFVDTSTLEAVERRPGWYGRYFDSPSMTFAHYEFTEGSTIHEHSHPQEEVWQVIEGELEIDLDGDVRIAGPGPGRDRAAERTPRRQGADERQGDRCRLPAAPERVTCPRASTSSEIAVKCARLRREAGAAVLEVEDDLLRVASRTQRLNSEPSAHLQSPSRHDPLPPLIAGRCRSGRRRRSGPRRHHRRCYRRTPRPWPPTRQARKQCQDLGAVAGHSITALAITGGSRPARTACRRGDQRDAEDDDEEERTGIRPRYPRSSWYVAASAR